MIFVEQLRRQPRKLHGRLHQQGRLRAEPVVLSRHRLSAHPWLIGGGSSDERKFKEYLRRHQMPTQVWYRGYPGLTAVDLERHALVRAASSRHSWAGCRRANGWNCCDAARHRLPRPPGAGALRLQASACRALPAGAGARPRGGAGVAARGAGDHRGVSLPPPEDALHVALSAAGARGARRAGRQCAPPSRRSSSAA